MKLGVQLFSVKDYKTIPEALAMIAEKGVPYVEPWSGLEDISATELLAACKNLGLGIMSWHIGLDADREQWAEILKAEEANWVISWGDAESKADWQKLADEIEELAQYLQQRGICLEYHNHTQELAKCYEGKPAIEIILERAPTVKWQVDLGWLWAGGVKDFVPMLSKWQRRISSLHIRDIAANSGCDIHSSRGAVAGTGVVPLLDGLSWGQKNGIVHYILETNPLDAGEESFVGDGFKFLKNHLS